MCCFCKNSPSRYREQRTNVTNSGLDIYSASDHLPKSLHDPVVGPSYDVKHTAFQSAAKTDKPRWEWLEEKVTLKSLKAGDCGSDEVASAYPGPFGASLEEAGKGYDDESLISRPEHAIFGLAMLGGGRVFGKAHLYGKHRY